MTICQHCGRDRANREPHKSNCPQYLSPEQRSVLAKYLAVFRKDWIAAGQPDAFLTVMMVKELEKTNRLLRAWASIAKGLNLTDRCGAIADYDDELASLVVAAARETLEWCESPQ